MKSTLIAAAAALALSAGAASAQSTNANDANANASPSPAVAQPATNAGATKNETRAAGDVNFIQMQQTGTLRAPKLVGVAVYDNNNKDVGKISDLLLDKDGKIETVVISIGGFLGIGSKDVALPYSDIHWQTEQRTAASGSATGANAPGTMNNSASTTPAGGTAAPAQKQAMNATQVETMQGYPDRAVLDVSQAQLKSAPEFKYASQTRSMNNGAQKQQ